MNTDIIFQKKIKVIATNKKTKEKALVRKKLQENQRKNVQKKIKKKKQANK